MANRDRPDLAGAPTPREVGGYGLAAWWWILALLVAMFIVLTVTMPWWFRQRPIEPIGPIEQTPPVERGWPQHREGSP